MSTKNKTTPALFDLMPQGDAALSILRARATRLKKETASPNKSRPSDNLVHYVHFKLGKLESYGIPFHYVKELMLNVTPTEVPHSPNYIAGVINRYGLLLSVVDLKSFFHLNTTADAKQTHLLVVEALGVTIVILVDTIKGSDAYIRKNLDTPLGTENAIKQKYLLGLHHGTTAILNIETLITDLQPHATPL